MRLPVRVGRLTGLSDEELRRAPRVGPALRRFRAFAGDALLVAHNARFDAGFVNRELDRLTGKRLAAPVLDTVPLARNLLRGRIERVSLASLAYFFGTSVAPCHRALPDAQATAEILLALIGLAQERGARTVADLEELAAPRPRACTASGTSCAAPRPDPASTSSATVTTRCSMSARPAISAPACVPTSPAAANGPRSRRLSAPSRRSSGGSSGRSSPPRSRRSA